MSPGRATLGSMAIFCAICTEPPPPGTELVQRPLGRDSALVLVCADCDTLHPRSGRYTFVGGGAGAPSTRESNMGNGNHRTPIR